VNFFDVGVIVGVIVGVKGYLKIKVKIFSIFEKSIRIPSFQV